jgi:hypothetical protein
LALPKPKQRIGMRSEAPSDVLPAASHNIKRTVFQPGHVVQTELQDYATAGRIDSPSRNVFSSPLFPSPQSPRHPPPLGFLCPRRHSPGCPRPGGRRPAASQRLNTCPMHVLLPIVFSFLVRFPDSQIDGIDLRRRPSTRPVPAGDPPSRAVLRRPPQSPAGSNPSSSTVADRRAPLSPTPAVPDPLSSEQAQASEALGRSSAGEKEERPGRRRRAAAGGRARLGCCGSGGDAR